MQRTFRLAGIIVVAVALACIAGAWYWHGHTSAKAGFRTAALRRGYVAATITATGTVEPEERVDVGAQVAGQLLYFGKDTEGKDVDYGSTVKEGSLLAQIDDTLYAADVSLGRASVAQDQAGEQRAAADLEQMRAKLEQAEADWNRAQMLGTNGALAPTTYDSYKFNYAVAKANVTLDQAALNQAKATTLQAQATLGKAERQLAYCTITSPVTGVIIDRRVNAGETVVSSLNSPSLFLIAKDLTRIQVWASVNEADIGSIQPGQPVTFTVDAYPNRVFRGSVNKVRLNATMSQNVVTYTVEVTAENKDGKLLPYLTANVRFLTAEQDNVLLAMNSALRWHPQADQIDPAFRQTAGSGGGPPAAAGPPSDRSGGPAGGAGGGGGGRRGGRRGGAANGESAAPQQTGTLWVAEGAYVKPISVNIGVTDGSVTEVDGPGLSEGMDVVVGNQVAEIAVADGMGANPFVPQFPRRGGGGGGGAPGGGPGGGPGGPGGGRRGGP